MRRRVASGLTAAIFAMALGGCSDDPTGSVGVETQPPTSTQESPTEPLSTPTDPQTSDTEPPAPPTMPALAKDKSTAGAKAFIEYYIDVLNYSFLAADAALLSAESPRSCALCKSFVQVAERIQRDGGAQDGGEWTPTDIELIARDRPRLILLATVAVAAGTSRASARGPVHRINADEIFTEFQLTWIANRWQIFDVRPA